MWAKDEDSEQTAAASALIPHRTAVSTCRLYTRGGDAVQALNQRDHKGGEWMTESGSSARERGGAGDRRAGPGATYAGSNTATPTTTKYSEDCGSPCNTTRQVRLLFPYTPS